MASVAEQLRNAREAQNLTVSQIADTTKVRGDHIRAIEEGNYDVFVAPVYIRGFVRTYARLLKLDVPKIMADLDGELNATEKFNEPPPLSNQPRGILDFLTLQLSRLNWRLGGVILAVAAAIGLILLGLWAWRTHQKRDPLSGLQPGVYKPAKTNGGETLPLPSPNPAPRR